MSFQIDYDVEEAIALFDEKIMYFDERLIGREAMQLLGDFLVDKLRSEIQNSGHVVTGEMLSETQVLEVGDDYVIVGNPTLQARIIEYGRVEVRPVDAKVLHWIDPDSGDDVFSKFSAAVPATHLFIKTVKSGIEEYSQKLAENMA